MSLKLFAVLAVLLVTNQIIGTCCGSWRDGFDKAHLIRGVQKIVILAVGYGALAFAAHFAGEYVPAAEYVSGLLIEPIAKYFAKICDTIRTMLDSNEKAEI